MGKCSFARGDYLVAINNQSHCDQDLGQKPEPSALKTACLYFGHRLPDAIHTAVTFRLDCHYLWYPPASHTFGSRTRSHKDGGYEFVRKYNALQHLTTVLFYPAGAKGDEFHQKARLASNKPIGDVTEYGSVPVNLYTCIQRVHT